MDADVAVFAQVMVVIVSSLAGVVTIGLGTRVLWRLTGRAKPRAVAAAGDARLERLEAAVESIAIEVERISEAQRFTVKLLTDRAPDRAPGLAADRAGELPAPRTAWRTNTPH
jgi:hypothetical protein